MREQSNSNQCFCLCGSGLPYEVCCKNKINPYESEITKKVFLAELDRLRKNYKRVCLYPNQSECSHMIHAHTISQKAVLSKIAHNGRVLMPVANGPANLFDMQEVGIEARASKFYCFCKKHDSIFYPIDKELPPLNETTYFLYAYRIFAYTYYKIKRELDCFEKLKQKYDVTSNLAALEMYKETAADFLQLEVLKNTFDTAILTPNYGCLTNTVVTMDYKVNFAAAVCFCPVVDIFGNWIERKGQYPLVYVTVIPHELQSRILISWLKNDNSTFDNFRTQIETVPRRFLTKYLNNLLPLNCENMTLNPLLWDKWGTAAQLDFKKMAYRYLNNPYIKVLSKTYFQKREYDLFLVI